VMKRMIPAVVFLSMVMVHAFTGDVDAGEFDKYPQKGKITLIDLGAGSCIPCKMMVPVLDRVKKRFAGKAEVIVIDLRYNRDQIERFQVRAIPTQVFFDRNGREVYRHVGFMDENAIVEQFAKMGVK